MCRAAHIAYMVRRRRPVGIFELHVGLRRIAGARRCAGRHALAARPAGQRDQRDIAAPAAIDSIAWPTAT
jgi:hypothetical protein